MGYLNTWVAELRLFVGLDVLPTTWDHAGNIAIAITVGVLVYLVAMYREG